MTAHTQPRLLIIGFVWPEATSSAAGVRDWEFVQALLAQGWGVTYASPSKENQFSEALRAAGVTTQVIAPNDSRFDDWVRDLKPDFVLFDRFVIEEQFGWRVKDNCPDAVRILDTQDLHFLRRRREKDLKNVLPTEDDSLREIASIYRSDLTLILSDVELELLQASYGIPESLLMLSPFSYPSVPERVPPFEERQHFAMIGNFRHPPNADAVLWLHREIWPLIRAQMTRAGLLEAEVHVYGAYPPREMMALTDAKLGFHVMGSVPDQYEMLKKYRVNLAPLRFGAGLKGKIADGWWSGTPAVTTPIGAEGMRLSCAQQQGSMGDAGSWGGLIETSASALAEAAVRLYLDRETWSSAVDCGRQILQTRFDRKQNGDLFVARLLKTRKELESLRQKNFVGRMLWFHQLRSTTYFSRWIELKNAIPRQEISLDI